MLRLHPRNWSPPRSLLQKKANADPTSDSDWCVHAAPGLCPSPFLPPLPSPRACHSLEATVLDSFCFSYLGTNSCPDALPDALPDSAYL